MIKFLTALYLRMCKIKGMVLNLQLPLNAPPNAIPRTAPEPPFLLDSEVSQLYISTWRKKGLFKDLFVFT